MANARRGDADVFRIPPRPVPATLGLRLEIVECQLREGGKQANKMTTIERPGVGSIARKSERAWKTVEELAKSVAGHALSPIAMAEIQANVVRRAHRKQARLD